MVVRHLPVRPDLEQLRHQAKDLLRALKRGEAEPVAEWRDARPDDEPAAAKLADAQHLLARSYGAANWARLAQAAQLADAIWRDDVDAVRDLITRAPNLVRESVLIRERNWGPPLSYAATLGRDAILELLLERGATDLEHALGRAVLKGWIASARLLHERLGKPVPTTDQFGDPAYTLNLPGTAFLFEIGASLRDATGRARAPVDVVLETDSRDPAAKHAILELYVKHGVVLPDTAPMALHRGRIDLLEAHLKRDPSLLRRTFTHREIYPAEVGCGDRVNATVGTPLGGTTLLHMAVDYGELEIARWLLDHGMDVNARSAVGDHGFGGYTALHSSVVSMPNFWTNHQKKHDDAPSTRLLLERGADPNVRASIWKELHPGYGIPGRRDYRDVTPLAWGRRFHMPVFVSGTALKLIEEAGGGE